MNVIKGNEKPGKGLQLCCGCAPQPVTVIVAAARLPVLVWGVDAFICSGDILTVLPQCV